MRTVLIVDDEPDVCRIVKLNLENTQRFKVLTATDGRIGIGLARSNIPDLILLDIMMPEMDGSQVAEDLSEHESTKRIPIVFLTALVRKDEVDQHGGYIHNHPFLAKPVGLPELIHCIDSVLGVE